jgi:hypothetical protein
MFRSGRVSNNRILDIFYQLSLTNIQEDIKHAMWPDLSAKTPYRKLCARYSRGLPSSRIWNIERLAIRHLLPDRFALLVESSYNALMIHGAYLFVVDHLSFSCLRRIAWIQKL